VSNVVATHPLVSSRSLYGAGLAVARTIGVGTGVTAGAEFGAIGATVETGAAEAAGAVLIIGAAVGTGTAGRVWLRGRLLVRAPAVGLVVGLVVVPVGRIVLVCAEANDSVITHDATIAR
jgi:hypothetical protein